MKHYAVIRVVGDNKEILELCSSREGVIIAKQLQREKHRGEDCHIAAIEGEFNESGELVENKFNILY